MSNHKQAAGSQRIGINAHLLSGEASYRRAGIHQYIAQVLHHLPQRAGDMYHIYTRHAVGLSERPDITCHHSRWPTERRSVRILWEQTAWPLQTAVHKLDLLHSMAFVTPLLVPCPTIVTVYDLSFIHYPQRFPKLQRHYLSSQTARSCRHARRVITISESSRQDVHQFFGVPLSQIDVVTPGVDAMYQPLPITEIAAFRQRQQLPQRFILHVGTLQPRKNIPVLLSALAQLPAPDVDLVLVGGKGWLYDDIFALVEKLGLTSRVHFTGYVADEDLPLWYNAASVLAFPSIYEGFGMPIVEAMACGTPVVAAAVSSIPEAGGDVALYFDPQDAAALAERLTNVLDDAALADKMRTQGLKRASHFLWAAAGRATAVAYQRALTSS